MKRLVFAVLLLTWPAPRALAQNKVDSEFPKVEGFVGYSGLFTGSILIKTGPASSGQTDLDSVAGFEGAIIRNVNSYFGFKGDASFHFGRYREEDFAIPCGLPPCSTQAANSHTRLFNFFIGPEVKVRNRTRATPFANALLGVTHTSTFFNTKGPALNFSGTTSDTGLATAFGGGLDVRIARRISFRFSSDYDLAFGQTSPAGSSKTLNSWRFSLGAVFH